MIEFVINLDNIVKNFFVVNVDRESFYFLFFKYFTELGDFVYITPLSFIFLIYICYENNFKIFSRKVKRNLIPFLATLVVTETVTFFTKVFVAREGPFGRILFEKDYSFPSGHASIAVAFFGILTYLYLHDRKARGQETNKNRIILTTTFIVFLIGLSRLILNVHYLSDVLAGFLVGGFGLFVGVKYKKI